MSVPKPPPTDRVRHYGRERLRAADLQDEHASATWLRGLHVLALHDTWGIALGFEVAPRDDDSVLVGPGLAYDYRGREIILPEAQALPAPRPVDKPDSRRVYDLVARYDPEVGRQAADPERLRCLEAERPALVWLDSEEVRLGLDVPLVRLDPSADATGRFDQSVRRFAQGAARPHIVGGLTPPEQAWEYWREGQRLLGYQTRVDTSAAGFVGTPHYLAHLRIPAQGLRDALARSIAVASIMIFTSLAAESAEGFTFRLALGASTDDRRDRNDGPGIASAVRAREGIASLRPFRVSWVGVEPVGGCAPAVDWATLLARPIGFASTERSLKNAFSDRAAVHE